MDTVPTSSTGRSGPGLEDQLRNLILTNGPPGSQSTQEPAASQPTASPGDVNEHHKAKKRPNQAQRRQMNSQFNIPIDTRAPASPESQRHGRGNSGPGGQRWRNQGPDPRQTDSHQHGNASHFHNNTMPSKPYAHGHGPHNNQSASGYYSPHNKRPQRGSFGQQSPSSWRGSHSSPSQQPRRLVFRPEEIVNQSAFLEQLSFQVVSGSEIERAEISEKEGFRMRIESIIRDVITQHEQTLAQRWDFPSPSVELKCFGSLATGFATKASDMDLALLSPCSRIPPDAKESPIPRLIEKALLDAGLGARLLSRTRVPIIKLCEKPSQQLYDDLSAYRKAWEDGLHDIHDGQEEDEVEPETPGIPATEEHEEPVAEFPRADNAILKSDEFEIPSPHGGEPQRFYLRQGPKASISAYSALAKHVLRKAGGRDVRGGTSYNFSDHEWDILSRVCAAFVRGLSDSELRQRLQSYPSLQFKSGNNQPDRHSMKAVSCQIEGEQFLLDLNRLCEKSGVDIRQFQTDQTMMAWSELQYRTDYGVDPVQYTREVQNALERLRKVPFSRIILLEQGPGETPTSYHIRASSALEELVKEPSPDAKSLERATVGHYISGISTHELRLALEAEYEGASQKWSLDTVSRRHKALALAREFARTLEKGVYKSENVADIQEYIKLLRTPPQITADGHIDDSVAPKISALVSRVRAVTDPHALTRNQQNQKYKDQLEFPSSGCGVQCDINFSALLALQNTILLRCYSLTDPRVRPMVLFVKHWAKMRGINSGYRGTLSSYGYVLMVLHYLVNVVQPFVCPNLQQLAPPPPPGISPADIEKNTTLCGYRVNFWRNEEEIMHLASLNQLNRNTESIGSLLRGFFEYYAQNNFLSNRQGKGFDWGRDVLSIRTPGGLVSKQEKGWTGAKTIYEPQGDAAQTTELKSPQPATDTDTQSAKPRGKAGDFKEVRLRYLFAIEDPFELDHNVARTVTHNGIVSIRDEFRRAWRIIKQSGSGAVNEDLLLNCQDEQQQPQQQQPQEGAAVSLSGVMLDIHGPGIFENQK